METIKLELNPAQAEIVLKTSLIEHDITNNIISEYREELKSLDELISILRKNGITTSEDESGMKSLSIPNVNSKSIGNVIPISRKHKVSRLINKIVKTEKKKKVAIQQATNEDYKLHNNIDYNATWKLPRKIEYILSHKNHVLTVNGMVDELKKQEPQIKTSDRLLQITIASLLGSRIKKHKTFSRAKFKGLKGFGYGLNPWFIDKKKVTKEHMPLAMAA